MNLSTENSFLRPHVGERGAIELLAKAGFDAIDYGFSPMLERKKSPFCSHQYLTYAEEISKIAQDNGVYFNQAHGPFVFDTSIAFAKRQKPHKYSIFCCQNEISPQGLW